MVERIINYISSFRVGLKRLKGITIKLRRYLYKKLMGFVLRFIRYTKLRRLATDKNFEKCSCPVCGLDSAKYLFSQKESFKYSNIKKDYIFDLVQCRRCYMVYVVQRLKEDMIRKIYKYSLVESCKHTNSSKIKKWPLFDDYHAIIEERKARFYRISEVISRKVKRGKILEIGSSFGYFLQICKEAGYEVYGIEPSKGCVVFSKNKLGLQNIAFTIWENQPFSSTLFDAVCMFEVIEHLYNPTNCLQYIDSRLKLGGYLFLSCPILRGELLWGDAHPVEHINYFTEETLKKIVMDTVGYEFVEFDEVFIFRKRFENKDKYDEINNKIDV